MHLHISSAKWQPICVGLGMLRLIGILSLFLWGPVSWCWHKDFFVYGSIPNLDVISTRLGMKATNASVCRTINNHRWCKALLRSALASYHGAVLRLGANGITQLLQRWMFQIKKQHTYASRRRYIQHVVHNTWLSYIKINLHTHWPANINGIWSYCNSLEFKYTP